MIVIPLKIIESSFELRKIKWGAAIDKLHNFGLEVSLLKENGQSNLVINPCFSRHDLNSWDSLLNEISIAFLWKRKNFFFTKKKKKVKKNISFKKKIILSKEFFKRYYWVSFWLLSGFSDNNKEKKEKNLLKKAVISCKEMFGRDFFLIDFDNCSDVLEICIFKKKKEEVKKKYFFLSESGITDDINIGDEKKNTLVGIMSKLSEPPIEHKKIINEVAYFSKKNITFLGEKKKIPIEKKIEISNGFIKKILGQRITNEKIKVLLERFRFFFYYDKKKNIFVVKIPFFRTDINSKEDLVSELMKLISNKKNESKLDLYVDDKRGDLEKKITLKKRKIRDYLVSLGWYEIFTYSLVSAEEIKKFENDNSEHFLKVINAKETGREFFRKELISSHLKVIKENKKYGNENIFFFEISQVFVSKLKFEEVLCLTGTGNILNNCSHNIVNQLDLYWVKSILENILQILNLKDFLSFNLMEKKGIEDGMLIMLKRKEVGFLGLLKSEPDEKDIIVCNLSLTKIFNFKEKEFCFSEPSSMPVCKRDLSFLVGKNTNCDEIIKIFDKNFKQSLKEVRVIDIFQNEKMKKEDFFSVCFRLIFQEKNYTLSGYEIDKKIKDICIKVEKKFGVFLRKK